MNYADNGNILFKTDAGNYKYHAAKINAVREVDNSEENITFVPASMSLVG